jgi:hypothetical protein
VIVMHLQFAEALEQRGDVNVLLGSLHRQAAEQALR